MLLSGNSFSDGAATTVNQPSLVRLLLVRELSEQDPAPAFPRASAVPGPVRERLGAVRGDIASAWWFHWHAVISEIGATAPRGWGAWSPWPAVLPEPSAADVDAWGVGMSRPPRGTPLEEHPSHRYYRARRSSAGVLPYRLIVLPFVGRFSARHSAEIGYISSAQLLDPVDDLYGFACL